MIPKILSDYRIMKVYKSRVLLNMKVSKF